MIIKSSVTFVPSWSTGKEESLGFMIEVLEAETDFSLDTEGIIDLIGVDEAEQDVAGTSKEED